MISNRQDRYRPTPRIDALDERERRLDAREAALARRERAVDLRELATYGNDEDQDLYPGMDD